MNNKLATAMAWHEESIREENEYAENDEINYQHINPEINGQKSSESILREHRKGP
jgi:hypothetical protein